MSSRVRVYEASDVARNVRETFTAKKSTKTVPFRWRWPAEYQNVGESLAVAYSSDKWDQEMTLYKHLAESKNRVLCVDGFLRDWDSPQRKIDTIGPWVSIRDVPMPREFAILALFEEANLRLYVGGTDQEPKLGRGDDGIVKVTVAHGMLGGSKMLWSQLNPSNDDQPFLFVYTEKEGPLMIIVGEELDIEADGIVG